MQTHNSRSDLKQMTFKLKLQIIEHMKMVPLHSAWGFAAKDFVENTDTKTDHDYEELLYELSSDIQDGPGTMQDILGPTFQFFHKLAL